MFAALATLAAPKVQAQTATPQYQVPSTTLPKSGTRQKFVPQHFDKNGAYVAPHYEPERKKLPFRGYFAKDEKARKGGASGYTLPAPDYAAPADTEFKRPEGR